MCYDRGEGNGKCSGTGAKPHSTVSSFQNGAARTVQGTAPMDPPLFGADFIRRRQKRRKKVRLSKTPSQPARDKGCGTQSPDTHNAACGIETHNQCVHDRFQRRPDTHNAACGIETPFVNKNIRTNFCPDTHNAACGIETNVNTRLPLQSTGPDTHNAACGIETYTAWSNASDRLCPDTHNAACGIETNSSFLKTNNLIVPTHIMPRAALTAKRLCVSFRSHRAVFVCKKRTAILTMRRTDVRIEIQKGTVERSPPLQARFPRQGLVDARRGHLFYRLTDIISMVNTTINPLDRHNVKGILLSMS